MNKKINKKIYGVVLAAILPVVVLLLLYRFKWYTFSFEDFIRHNYNSGSLGDFLSMSVLVNLIPFILGNQVRWTEFTKGVFMMTIIYAIPIVILYFVS